ncbi:acyl-CoA dehydrogenase C-terminal domain-containing protein [Shewanella gelidii]|uniref:3-methylmercaptopropionyl-CoA dehydrogenase n=1 Tax=Shewanella gelidii TaxID=1642821 RepID=A0A917N8S1_9GAMM|nr:acyl-CoA dehydrogenase C-terminal domain-containing protein [Shewanella gelidii]MCL1099469.1 acyl-CoA dehydrogenase C-terminal domain-containing protein [Shewanella gelidii]GGI77237.1 acyl-CoA dehydrogenase [Shewanella gelidii]
MPTYQAPLRDFQFILDEMLNIYEQQHLEGFEQVDADLVDAIFQGMADFATKIMLPLNSSGDAQGCKIEDGQVTTPQGFQQAYKQFVEDGWATLTCDPEYGGQGLPEVVGTFVTEIQAATNMAFAMYPGLTHGAYSAIHAHGSAKLKRKYLPKLVSGEWTGTMNLTESHAGTDLALLRTKAEPCGEDVFAISGEKIFISSGDHDLAENIIHLVLARLPGAPSGVKGISLFAVPKFWVNEDGSLGENTGVQASALEHKMGIHGNSTCVMVFDGAKGELVGEAHQGLRAMFTMMNQARLGVGMQGLAQSDISYQNALAYAQDRLQGRALSGVQQPKLVADPILVHGDVRRMLLAQKSFNEGARALVGQQALWIDQAERHQDKALRQQASLLAALFTPVVKGFITDQGFKACVDAQQVFGGHGYVHEWGMEQFVRDARIAMIYEGTNGVQALDLVGRKIMGDQGAALMTWAEQAKQFIEESRTEPQMEKYSQTLIKNLGDLEKATQYLAKHAPSKPDVLGSASMAYMQLLGITSLTLMWARMAKLALRALASQTQEHDFYQSKLKTADFYMSYWAIQTRGLVVQIESSAEQICEYDAALF